MVWLALVSATVASWLIGHDSGSGKKAAASIVVILVAFFKVRLVGLYFMELRKAPKVLRLAFESYWALISLVIIVMYLI